MAKKQILLYLITLIFSLHVPAIAYEFVDLGTISGSTNSYASSINNSGQVVGYVRDGYFPNSGVLFSGTGTGNIDLGGVEARDINNNGIIVGTSNGEATLFDSTGTQRHLGTLSGYDSSFGYSINDYRQVVGRASGGSLSSQAILYNPYGSNYSIRGLGTLAGYEASHAWSINNSGQVVGASIQGLDTSTATLFDVTGTGNNISLGTLGGYYSEAYSINDNGKIVGAASYDEGPSVAVLFDETGGGNNISLGTIYSDDFEYSVARSINNLGQIVGDSYGYYPLLDRATLFDPTGKYWNNIDLNTVVDLPDGWVLRMATDINDDGWIVGWAEDDVGNKHAYLLIPEPMTLGLIGIGAIFLRRKI